jgi:hypothetical protein
MLMFSTTFAVHDSCWTNLFCRLESFTKGQVVSEQYKTFDFPVYLRGWLWNAPMFQCSCETSTKGVIRFVDHCSTINYQSNGEYNTDKSHSRGSQHMMYKAERMSDDPNFT